MTTPAERCPRCGGVVKAGAQWCGLCYADLRPPPPPLPVPDPEPVVPPAHAPPPLFAPVRVRDALDGDESEAPESAEGVGKAAQLPDGWPCIECGALNAFDLEACAACGLPFGAGLRTPPPTLPGDRRTRILVATLVALAVVALIAIVSMATGSPPPEEKPAPREPIVVEQ